MGQWIESIRGIVGPEDCDVNRHMNVRGYFEQFGEASGYLLKRVGLYYSDVVESGCGMGTVVNTIRYRSELVDGDPYVIQSAFVRIGRSSVRYVHKMINETTGELSASSESHRSAFFSRGARVGGTYRRNAGAGRSHVGNIELGGYGLVRGRLGFSRPGVGAYDLRSGEIIWPRTRRSLPPSSGRTAAKPTPVTAQFIGPSSTLLRASRTPSM